MLEAYDESLLRFFEQIKWQGQVMPVVFAGPDRAHAQAQRWLKENRNKFRGKLSNDQTIPYPFCAIYRDPFARDGERDNPGVHRNINVNKDEGFAITMQTPKAVSTNVDVNFYMRDKFQARIVEVWVHTLFPSNVGFIDVDFGNSEWYKGPFKDFEYFKLLGQNRYQLDLNNFVDSSTIEQSGLEQKEMRYTLSCLLHCYIPYQPYTLPVNSSFKATICDEQSEQVIDEVEIEGE